MKWSNYTWEQVRTGKDENGSRLISQFAKEYKERTGNSICVTCPSSKQKFNEFKKQKKMSKSKYVLKAKYNGIPLKFGSNVLVTNSNMTDEYGKQLLKNHPRGKELFESIPDGGEEITNLKDLEAAITGATTVEEAEAARGLYTGTSDKADEMLETKIEELTAE